MAAGRWGPLGYKDLTGQRFGRLLVLGIGHLHKKVGATIYYWKCLCDCGAEREVRGDCLRGGYAQSCGCYHRELVQALGKSKSIYGSDEEAAYRSLYASFIGSAKTRQISCDLTFEDWFEVVTKPCAYTGEMGIVNRNKFRVKDLRVNGLDRIDSALGYCKSNVQSCLPIVNIMKSDLTEAEFIYYISLIYKNLQIQQKIL